MHAESKKLREQRQVHVESMQALVSKAEGEDRDLNDEEKEKFGTADSMQAVLKNRIDRMERAYELERENLAKTEQRHERQTGSAAGAQDAEEQRQREAREYRAAWHFYVRHGMEMLKPEQRQTLELGYKSHEKRQQGVDPDTAGGYTVPDEAMAAIDIAEKEVGALLNVVAIQRTTSGANWPIPTTDDTNNKGRIVAEHAPSVPKDIVFGQIVLGAYMYTSDLVLVSRQLLQDSNENMDVLVPALLAQRIGRIVNEHFTIGTGTDEPNGITNCPNGNSAAGAAGPTYPDLLGLEHSVDPAYRGRPGTRWSFHDDTLRGVKELVDNENRPLWLPSVRVGEPDRILGYPYTINQDMPTWQAGGRPMVFGDHSKYQGRVVRGMQILRLNERYAENLQVAFLGFERWDGDIIDAGTGPLKHIDVR